MPSFIGVGLLALMFLLAGGAALRESVTFDELAHVGAGLSYWQKFDLRFNEEHPPLAKLLAGLPLALRGTHADYSHVSWTESKGFFTAFMGQWVFGEYLLTRWNKPAQVLAWARFPMLLLTLALGWVIFAMGRRLGGPWGGLLALTAYVTAPVFLAFGPLVLTDVAITLFSLLSLWAFSKVLKEPTRRNTALFALSLAGALLSKFSSGILFFAFAGVALSLRWWPVPGQPEDKLEFKAWRKQRRRALFKGTLWAAIVVYVVYFVFSWNQPSMFEGPVTSVLGRFLMPPWLYLRGMFMVVITGNRPTFLLGHHYPHGTWLYFPVLLFLKSPLGFLGLGALGVALALYWRKSKAKGESLMPAEVRTHWRVLWVSLIVFGGLCIVSHLNVCFRHFSVPLVLMMLLLAPIPMMIQRLRVTSPRTGFAAAVATVLLAASCVFAVVRQYPYYFPYVNALSFGRPAYTLMSDANVDWNQSLPDVQRFAERHGIQALKIDGYAFTESNATVPGSQLWDCQNPGTEDAGHWVVVSANAIIDTHNCTWLMQYPRESLAAGSMYAFRLPAPIPAAGSPGGPPSENNRRVFLGMGSIDMRSAFQDLVRHPDRLSTIIAEYRAEYEKMKAEQEAKKKSGK
jgi:4-amino-4-deoxy-L-arabinose transferase-like glycosyltransferase